jgi:hypothetical protein
MATITVDTYLDGGTARTAGEAWTNNGGRLTVRTDTRWHANAPASMTGTLGSVTISATLGGGFTIDGRNVRWMAYTGGSGTVPTIGTTISQGAVSGYLLGVWASATTAPTAVGAAMPATGFIKLREVTGGTFAASALTGITATGSVDVTGWIEVVMDQSANITVPRLGDFTVRGKWFELGTTSGAANQLVQVPTNGSTTAYVPGVYIDDAPITITGATWSSSFGGLATITAPSHGLTNITRGDQRRMIFIQGISPSGWNFPEGVICTVLDANTIVVAMASDPGAYTSGGTLNSHSFYPAIYAAVDIAANVGTDVRSPIICMETTGQVRIGHNGTVALGYVPPSGRKIRVPNVFLRQCTTAARATNVIPSTTLATRPDFTTSGAGVIDVEYALSDWYFIFAQAYSVRIYNVAIFDGFNLSEVASPIDLFNCGMGVPNASASVFALTTCKAGGKVVDCYFDKVDTSNNNYPISIQYCADIYFTRVRSSTITFARLAAAWYVFLSSGMRFYDCSSRNNYFFFSTSSNCLVDGYDHCDRFVSTTVSTAALYSFIASGGCDNIKIRDVTFGLKGTIANVHPYTGMFNITASKNITMRECGTRSTPLTAGSANQTGYIYVSGGNNSNIKLQRIYLTSTRTGSVSGINSDVNVVYENVNGDFADTVALADLTASLKGCGSTNSTTGQTAVYGTHVTDFFTADTTGRVVLGFNENNASTSAYVTKVAGTPKFTSAGNLVLAAVGDEVIIEQHYYAIGHTALANIAPTITGTNVTYSSGARWGNHDIYYQIDTGSGYGGTWKNLTAANLSGETISAVTGFKLKFRFVGATASTTNLLTYIRIDTVSTLAAQVANLYPLDINTVSLTGLIAGSEVRVYNGTDPSTATLVTGIETSGTSFSFTHSLSGVSGYIVIFALGYQPVTLPITFTASDISIPVQQTIDRVYENA